MASTAKPPPLASGPRWWQVDFERAEDDLAMQRASHGFGSKPKEQEGVVDPVIRASGAPCSLPPASDADDRKEREEEANSATAEVALFQ